jgi:uncharacterized protein
LHLSREADRRRARLRHAAKQRPRHSRLALIEAGGHVVPRARRGPWPDECGLSNSIPDCLRCGVCCHSNLDTYVRLTGDDWARLGVEAGRVAHFIGNRAYMRMSERGHCAALDVLTAADGTRQFFCTIYDKRPQVCRDLGRGSPECEGELAGKAVRVAGGV